MESFEFHLRFLADTGADVLDDPEARRRIAVFADSLGPNGHAHGTPTEMAASLTAEGENLQAARGEAYRILQAALDESDLYGYFRTADVRP